MINPIELRIGNFIHRLTGESVKMPATGIIYTIASTMFSSVELIIGKVYDPYNGFEPFEESARNLSPIPITEEWLLRFGFYKVSNEFYINDEKTGRDSLRLFKQDEGYLPAYYKHHIKFVHQLQNIYFALTGEELELKE